MTCQFENNDFFRENYNIFTFKVHACIVIIMINTYNETDLHKTLKEMYAKKYDGKMEVQENDVICDVLCDDSEKTVIEIQTKGLYKLMPKLLKLKDNHTIRVVHPLVTEFRIELYDEDGKLISRRRSPKRLSMLDVYEELMGIYPLLGEPWFTLEVIPVSCTETRIRTKEPVQLANKSRRFKRNWYKTGRKLDSMQESVVMHGLSSYIDILPEKVQLFRDGTPFCAKDLYEAGCGKHNYRILWVLKKAEAVEFAFKKGKTSYYKFV